MTYEIDIAGMKRHLPLCKLNDSLMIGAFVIFGDVELTKHCAKELLKKVPEFDIMIAPEAKAIPLIYEMAAQANAENYIIARKKAKAYMSNAISVTVQSITTAGEQTLIIDEPEAKLMQGKRVLAIDDVISTGESIKAVEKLVEHAGGQVVGRVAVLAEGDAADRDDIIVLGKLPLFDKDGNPIG